MPRYDGPIIDAHHHLWDLSLGRHPWLAGGTPLGGLELLQRDYLIADLMAAIGDRNVVASVHVEALWDPARDPIEELQWLDGLARPDGIAGRYIGFVPLEAADAQAQLERQVASTPRLVGLRQTVRWHPDPKRSWAAADKLDDPAWRRGVALLGRRGLLLELLMNPHQAAAVARLAGELPEQIIIVNHCCSPGDADPESRLLWRDGLRAMAAHPNVAIKISNASAFAASPAPADLGAIVWPCIEAFGPRRSMFGTDWPVLLRTTDYAAACATMRILLEGFAADEQRAMFHDTAAALYGFVGR